MADASPSPRFGGGGHVSRPTPPPLRDSEEGDTYHGRRLPLSEIRRGGQRGSGAAVRPPPNPSPRFGEGDKGGEVAAVRPPPNPLSEVRRGDKGGEVLRSDLTPKPSPRFGERDTYHAGASPFPASGEADEGGEVLRSDLTPNPSPRVRREGHVLCQRLPSAAFGEGDKGGEVASVRPPSPLRDSEEGDTYHGRRLPLSEIRRGGQRG